MAVEEEKDGFKRHRQKCGKLKKIQEPDTSHPGNYKSRLPPYITVDDLRLYRKARPAFSWPNNHLKIEEGDFKSLKSEYKRAFKNFYEAFNKSLTGERDVLAVRAFKPEVSLKLDGLHDFQSEYNESFTKHSMESLMQPSRSLQIMDNEISRHLPVPEAVSYVDSRGNIVRSRLLKRPTNLRIEGEFLHITEHAEKFIKYLIAKRSELLRIPTTLKLEGEMETKTETSEKFVRYDKLERAPLCKKFSNLHLEGELEIVTEKQDKFLPFEIHRRPPLTKKSTNLHLEGDLCLLPEYRRQYVEYKGSERPKLAVPMNNLKTGGLFENGSNGTKPLDQTMHPLIPFLRDSDKKLDAVDHRTSTRGLYLSESIERKIAAKSQLESRKSTSHPNLNYVEGSNLSLEGSTDMNPEYKSSYIDSYKHGKMSSKIKSKRRTGLDYMREYDKMEVKPEYSSSNVNFPRQRPYIHKPECHLSNEGEVAHITEKSEKFVPFRHIKKTEAYKREPELKLEGHFECQPEYRKAYIDYLIREKPATEKRRAFELVPNADEASDTTPKDGPRDDEQSNATEKGTPSEQIIEKSKQSLAVPTTVQDSSSISSRSSSPKPSAKPSRLRKLSQLETSAFGPRCPQGKSRRSLTPSPVPPTGRATTLKITSRDISPKLVAGRSTTPQRKSGLLHIPRTKVSGPEYNGWGDSFETDKAFLVLDDRVPRKRVSPKSLYKEQKWMPAWDYSSQ